MLSLDNAVILSIDLVEEIMTEYVYSIIVRDISEEQAFAVIDLPGALGAGSVGGLPYVEFEATTDMPDAAVDTALRALRGMGLEPLRLDVDLVNIAGIAERTGVSRQAVRMWIEGERRRDFPLPYSASGGLRTWLWSDVHPWLVANKVPLEEEYAASPLPSETVHCFNGHLADPHSPYAAPSELSAVQDVLRVAVGRASTEHVATSTWLATDWSPVLFGTTRRLASERTESFRDLIPLGDWKHV